MNNFMTEHERDVFWRLETAMSELEKRGLLPRPTFIRGSPPDPERQLEGIGVLGGQPSQ